MCLPLIHLQVKRPCLQYNVQNKASFFKCHLFVQSDWLTHYVWEKRTLVEKWLYSDIKAVHQSAYGKTGCRSWKKNEHGDDSWRWSTFYFLWFYWICVDLNMVGNEMSTWNLHMLDLKRFQYQILVVLWPFLISHGWSYGCLNNDTEEQKKSLNCIYYWSLTSSNIIHRS